MSWQLASIIPAWILAVVAAVLVGVFVPPDAYLRWIPISLAGVAVVAFGTQLAIQRKEGFVVRVMASVAGAVIVLAVATVVLPAIA